MSRRKVKKKLKEYDVVIIGSGIYGLRASLNENYYNKKILVLEKENSILSRASYINQARLHNGYHYPRSEQTAGTSAKYFKRFYQEYKFAINDKFKSIYAISKNDSYTSKEEFEKFCRKINIPCKKIDTNIFFNKNVISAAYETEEYVFDINLIKQYYIEKMSNKSNIEIQYDTYIKSVEIQNSKYILKLNNNKEIITDCVINTSYASINQINELFNEKKYHIKYELCEVELGKVDKNLLDVAITIMDGAFFSIMPFGKTKFHSLTSVNYTPHETCYKDLPEFKCQKKSKSCDKYNLDNCNNCNYKPKIKVEEMSNLYYKYIKNEYKFDYEKSLFTIKPILLASEIDDSRPTVITMHRQKPTFISCLSGKINTVYLLDEFINKIFKK